MLQSPAPQIAGARGHDANEGAAGDAEGFAVKFVHVGLAKCASTFLQQIWHADQAYQAGNPAALVQTLRERAGDNRLDAVNITAPGSPNGRTAIISSEGFSAGWINGTGGQQSIRNLRKVVADSLSASKTTGQILVIVRNPVDWLRALHEQAVKEGGYHPYRTYIAYKKELALEILDLGSLVGLHREAGRKVVILSADELRRSPQTFWDRYAAALDAPKPAAATLAAAKKGELGGNASLKERVPYLAKLNRHSAQLGECFTRLAKYPALFKAESEGLRPAASQHWVWINRRIAEFAKFSELKALAGEVEDAAGFQDVFVDPDMAQRIETTFIACLAAEETIDQELVAAYRRSLKERLRTS